MTDPASFRAGAEAMRARIIAGIRRWWGDARRSAGHRWPGHPHWLEVAVARIDAEELLAGGGAAGLAGGADALDTDAEGLGDGGHGRQVGVAPPLAANGSVESARVDPLGISPSRDAEIGFQQVGSEQVGKSLGSVALRHGATTDSRTRQRNLLTRLDKLRQPADSASSERNDPGPLPIVPRADSEPRPHQNPKAPAMTTLHAPVAAAQPLLLPYTLPITDLDARVLSRTAGFWSQDDHEEPTAFVEVSGRCGGSPFVARVTVVGWEGEERLFAGCAQDVADEARWHLEPFLGELSRSQVEALVAEVTDAAKEVA